MSHLVSVIMPAYNAERYIADSVRSVLAQTYSRWELVIVDDGSTDATADVVREFVSADARIKYVHQPNGRLGKARNTAVRHSTGDLIAFLDSDDLWLPEKLDLQIRMLEAHGADIVYSDGFIFRDQDVADESTTFPVICGKREGVEMFDRLLLGNSIPVLSVILRREALERAGPFEERQPYHGSEDYDLWLRLAKQGNVFYGMKERLVRYRRHASAMTHAESNVLKPMLAVVKKHMGDSRLGEHELKTRLRGLYRDLVSALLEEGRLEEARSCLKQLLRQDKLRPSTLGQAVLIHTMPGQYRNVHFQLNRARESFFYRVVRPIESAWRVFAGRAPSVDSSRNKT